MYLSVDFDALRKPVKFLDHTRCCLIVTAKRVAALQHGRTSVVLASCEVKFEENRSARRENDSVLANSPRWCGCKKRVRRGEVGMSHSE